MTCNFLYLITSLVLVIGVSCSSEKNEESHIPESYEFSVTLELSYDAENKSLTCDLNNKLESQIILYSHFDFGDENREVMPVMFTFESDSGILVAQHTALNALENGFHAPKSNSLLAGSTRRFKIPISDLNFNDEEGNKVDIQSGSNYLVSCGINVQPKGERKVLYIESNKVSWITSRKK